MKAAIPPLLASLVLAASGSALAQQDSPFARYRQTPPLFIDGTFYGGDNENRSKCSNPLYNGQHATAGQFIVGMVETGDFSINEATDSNITCQYRGRYKYNDDGRLGVDGTYSCTDGRQGTFHTRQVDATGSILTIRMDVQLAVTETCTIDKVINVSRFWP
jgi:hypothetical protein